jgi:hypothetical protein
MKVLLIFTYELGHQPFGLASSAAWLAEEGAEASCLDLAVESLGKEAIRAAGLSEPWYCCAEPTENQLAEF